MIKYTILLLLLLSTPCYAQNRIDGGIAAILETVIRHGAGVASGGRFNPRLIANEMIQVGSGELTGQVYDNYYSGIREQHKKEALDLEYQIWAQQEDRKNGFNREDYFRRRYYGR